MTDLSAVRPRLRVPTSAAPGEIVEIRTLISHPMESGQRVDAAGQPIPRLIIHSLVARYNGREVFRADWGASVAANPYQAFMLRIDEPGELTLTWTDDLGNVWTDAATIAVG